VRGWSREPIQWPALRLADAEVKLAGRSLAYGPWRIEQPAATATLEDGTIDVATLTGTSFGGRLAASGRFAAAADTPELRVKLSLSDADLKDALAAAAGTALVGGRGDVEASLAGAGRSAFELVSHIGGDVRLGARNGSLAGVNLAAVRDQLDRPDRPADLFALFKAAAGGATRFSSLDGTFHVADGVARSDDLHLVADGGDGRATSVVDLPDWTMETQVELRLAGLPDAPPLVLRLDGALDDPRKVVEVNPLSRFLTQRSANEPAQGQAGADRLRDLLKGLRTRP
jgi:uncharacterized protein involved in outer membrane biogenesis